VAECGDRAHRARVIILVGRLAIERFLGAQPLTSRLAASSASVNCQALRSRSHCRIRPVPAAGFMRLVMRNSCVRRCGGIATRLPELVRESDRARSVA
jgi:hypothetical protein